MSKKFFSFKRIFIISAIGGVLGLSILFGLSYYIIYQLTFAREQEMHGKKLSDLTNEIRSELLKRPYIKTVTFKTADNLTLSGLLVKRAHPQANVVICHGYRCSKELQFDCVDLFPEWNILLFDFRAHGQSEGQYTTIGYHEYKDVLAACAFMKQNSPNNLPFVILGISMGGAATLKAVSSCNGKPLCDALIIDSSYSNLYSTVYRVFAKKSPLPRSIFLPFVTRLFNYFTDCDLENMKPCECIKTIKEPIFLIHSCGDTFIPAHHSIKLFANVKNAQSSIWIAPPCRHGQLHTYQKDDYSKKIKTFVHNVIHRYSNQIA